MSRQIRAFRHGRAANEPFLCLPIEHGRSVCLHGEHRHERSPIISAYPLICFSDFKTIRLDSLPVNGLEQPRLEKSVYREENLVLLRLLKQCRVESGLTQGQFAQALDRPQSFVSDIERGLRRLDLIQLRDICHALGLDLVRFVERFETELAAGSATSPPR